MAVSPGSSSSKIPDEYFMLPAHLSDAGKYSYCTMCMIAMHELFNNEWDKEFTKHCLDKLLTHLQLPKTLTQAMLSLLSGEFSQSIEPCLQVLKDEKIVEADCSAILYDFILVAVKDGTYDARWRVLVQYLANQLGIPPDTIEQYELSVIDCLTRVHQHQYGSEHEDEKRTRQQQTAKFKRYALIGLASLGGGALIGVTGGLAAPFIGAGIASLGLGSVVGGGAALLGTAAGVAVVGSLFGAAGAGLAGYKMHKRVGEIEEFGFDRMEFEQSDNNNEPLGDDIGPIHQRLHISILISGWLKDEGMGGKPSKLVKKKGKSKHLAFKKLDYRTSPNSSYVRPWMCSRTSREQYFLRYESRYLVEFGRAIDYILSMVASFAAQEALKFTALSGLLSAIAWPGALVGLANIIDNPWSVCCRRSAQVGKQLAEVLLAREQGHRPVTLVGFSIGARVIYYCLQEMSERSKCEGIIQDAIMIGAPCSGDPQDWSKFTRVVAGRLINGYCRSDWLLKYLYRTFSMTSQEVAGLHPIELNDRRMCNVDLTEIVSGHTEYADKICLILRAMKVKVKEGPCGEVKIPKAVTLDQIPNTNKMDHSPIALRRTQSHNTLLTLHEEKSKNEDLSS